MLLFPTNGRLLQSDSLVMNATDNQHSCFVVLHVQLDTFEKFKLTNGVDTRDYPILLGR